MKNKALIIIICIVTILLVVLLGVRYDFSGNKGKLKSSINYPTTNGLAFSCDTTTITVDSEATCTLVGYWTGGITGIESQVSLSSGLELVKISEVNTWTNMDIEPIINYMYKASGSSPDQFTIAEVKVKGVSAGNQTLSLVPYEGEQSVYVQTKQNSDDIISTNNSVPNVNQAIIVTDPSGNSGSGTCALQLTSTSYKIDNTKQTIDVNKEDTIDTIKNNLSLSCGTISVTTDKVVISNGNDTKTYTINRTSETSNGQNIIMYVAIIAGVVLVIGLAIFIKKKRVNS